MHGFFPETWYIAERFLYHLHHHQSMRISIFLFIACCTLIPSALQSQDATERPSPERPSWVPRGLLFQPLRANIIESRMGGLVSVLPQTPRPALRLDIGHSIDLFAFNPRNVLPTDTAQTAPEVRLGADFFTFTRLRSEINFRFPVETTDFFFGVNASVKAPFADGSSLSGRLRVAHISAHLVDGYPQYQETFVYSREFVDAVAAFSPATSFGTVRFYAGASLLFHSIPDFFGTAIPQLGVDATIPLLGLHWLSLCAGYDAKILTVSGATSLAQSAQIGVKIGEKFGHGVVLSAYWYDGVSLHGMFYKQRDSYVGIGFQIE